MKAVMGDLKGKADGKLINKIVVADIVNEKMCIKSDPKNRL